MTAPLLPLVAILAALAWVFLTVFHWRFWRSDQVLPEIKSGMKKWPEVVAIIPARNEAAVLGSSLQSVAGQAYPGTLNVILVNDQSSDDTAKVAAAIKGRAPVYVLDAPKLEPGWAGKLWAINQGVELAAKKFKGADYFWFTDADITHDRDVLKGLAEAAVLDQRVMVSQMVRLHCKSFWEKALVPAFIYFFEMFYPFKAVNSDTSRRAGAAGGCILLKTDILTKIGGIAAIRTALIDDCAMARAVKDAGERIWLGFGLKSDSIRPHTFSDFWMTVTRTAFTQLRLSYFLLIGATLGLALLFLAPVYVFALGTASGNPAYLMLGGGAWLIMAVQMAPTLRLYRLSPVWGLFLPAIALLYMVMTLHSALRHALGRGGKWKERHYNFDR